MADFSRTLQKTQAASPTLSKKISNGNGFTAKTAYDDVFGGPPKFGVPTFSSRIDDYNEIFGNFHASRASSIPILDLPVVDERDVLIDVRSTKFDYSEVFGGFNGFDFAISYEELLAEPKERESSSEDVWTPAETGSASEGSSEDPVCSENNQPFLDEESHQSCSGTKQFNMSFHKSNQISEDDGINATTHITKLNSVPAFTFVLDENIPLEKSEQEESFSNETKVCESNEDFSVGLLEGNNLQEALSQKPASHTVPETSESTISLKAASHTVTETSESNLKPQITPSGNVSFFNEEFLTVAEISLRTQPSHVPPPSRPPPNLNIKQGDSKRLATSRPRASESYIGGRAVSEESPPFFDVEVDASSSAAASAAAMKEAMEKAQARLKSAKESMERKRERLQNRKKLGLKDDLTSKERKEGETIHEAHRQKEKARGTFGREDNKVKYSAAKMEVVPDTEVRGRFVNASKELVEQNRLEESKSTQEFHKQEDGTGEWKVQEEYYELVKMDKFRVASEGPKHERGEKELIPVQKAHASEKAAVTLIFDHPDENDKILKAIKVAREACVPEEHQKEIEAFKEVHEQEEYKKELSVVQDVLDQEENVKKIKVVLRREEQVKNEMESHEREEREKSVKEAPEWEEHGQKLIEIGEREENEMTQKAACERESQKRERVEHEREENAKRLGEAREKEENEKKLKQVLELEEAVKRQKEASEREENEIRLQKARELEENEKILKEARELEENEKRQNEALDRERIENERKLTEAREREENEKRLNEACEKEETEKRLNEACEWDENEKRQKEAQETKEIEGRQQEEARKMEANERRLQEARKIEDNEKKLKAAQAAFLQTNECIGKTFREPSESAESEEKLKSADEVCKQDGGKKFEVAREACEQEGHGYRLEFAKLSCEPEDIRKMMETSKPSSGNKDDEKKLKASEKLANEEDFNDMLQKEYVNRRAFEQKDSENKKVDSNDKVHDIEKNLGESKVTIGQDKIEKIHKTDQVAFKLEANKINHQEAQGMQQLSENGKKLEAAHPSFVMEQKRDRLRVSHEVNINQDVEPEVKNFKEVIVIEEKVKEENMHKERDQVKERLRKAEEDKEKEREREQEKDRMAVERATREARERAFADARERAERAAVERATAEARQRAMAEARERLEKASAEAREKSLAEKVSTEARLRLERAAVERANAEARERAAEKARADNAALGARGRTERTYSEKFSATSRDSGMRHSSSFNDVQDSQFQSSNSSSSSQRYPNSSTYGASHVAERFQGVETETALRCKARLERHQRTVERAATALAEKNMRDLVTQKEQTERNRLADTLDADVKRWSSGKEGNLRALLSTLQYILGPDSGWQPIPLTEVITAVAVKKAYRKATLCVHPDKLQQRGATIHQKYICEKVFDLLKEAWNKFNSEER